jgi:squalene-hopene/tetraprenyl-beta-curcumene cyclase
LRVELTKSLVAALFLAIGICSGCSRSPQTAASSWNPKAAAAYLDQREVTWMGWPGAARDHGTFCVSCHTVLPYTLARPALRQALAEAGPSGDEHLIVENVSKRVRLWNEVGPYYTDDGYGNGKPAQSRGTESVLNALILVSQDAQTGKLSDLSQMALTSMWAQQLADGDAKGAWSWLQFGMEPWEANDSQYFGAALAAIAVGTAPENYRSSSSIQPNLDRLRNYLNRNAGKQSLMNRVALLWASTKLPGLLDSAGQKTIIHEIMKGQQSDGGWALSAHAWPEGWSLHSVVRRRLRSDWTRQSGDSDGFATAFFSYVLQEAGVSPQDPSLKRGLSWLVGNQDATDGSWPSYSLNLRRNQSSNVGHFMRDAATAYAVLALSMSERPGQRSSATNVSPASIPKASEPNHSGTISAD